jgi:hypothetical protein
MFFWAFGPPVWFFVERTAGEPKSPGTEAAEKIWAAVLAAVLFFVASIRDAAA